MTTPKTVSNASYRRETQPTPAANLVASHTAVVITLATSSGSSEAPTASSLVNLD